MHIILTEDKGGHAFTIEAGLILTARRAPDNVLLTHVITGIQGPGGLQAFQVRESPAEIGRRVNAASKSDIPPTILGFPET